MVEGDRVMTDESRAPRPLAWLVRSVAETGSTNADVLAAARAGEGEGLVLCADHQTAGRGRLGRTWVAPPGASILCSILLRPPLPAGQVHLVTTAVALAAADACDQVAGVAPRLKWPNDLLVGERKVAGLLAESVVIDGRVDAVVVGIGLNVEWPHDLPADLAEIATALNHHAPAVARAEVLDAMLEGLAVRYQALCDEGPSALLVEAGRRSATVGQTVRVELAGRTIEGVATALTPEGQLVVAPADGPPQVVVAGDVVHLRTV